MSDLCIVCGAVIPEGRQVCPICATVAGSVRGVEVHDLEMVKEGVRQCLKYSGTCSGCPYSEYRDNMSDKDCMEVLRDDVLELLNRREP